MVVNPYKTVATEANVQCHQPFLTRRAISRTAIVILLLVITVVSYWFHIHHSLSLADIVQETPNLRGKPDESDLMKFRHRREGITQKNESFPIKEVTDTEKHPILNNIPQHEERKKAEKDTISDEPQVPVKVEAEKPLGQTTEQPQQYTRKVNVELSTKKPLKPTELQNPDSSSLHSGYATLKPIHLSTSKLHKEEVTTEETLPKPIVPIAHETESTKQPTIHIGNIHLHLHNLTRDGLRVLEKPSNITLTSSSGSESAAATVNPPPPPTVPLVQQHVIDVDKVVKEHSEEKHHLQLHNTTSLYEHHLPLQLHTSHNDHQHSSNETNTKEEKFLSDHNLLAKEAYLHLVNTTTTTLPPPSQLAAPTNTEKGIAPGTSVTTIGQVEAQQQQPGHGIEPQQHQQQQQQPPVVVPQIPMNIEKELLEHPWKIDRPHIGNIGGITIPDSEHHIQPIINDPHHSTVEKPLMIPPALPGGDYVPPHLPIPAAASPNVDTTSTTATTATAKEKLHTTEDGEELTPVATYNPQPQDGNRPSKFDLSADVVKKLKMRQQLLQQQPQSMSELLQKVKNVRPGIKEEDTSKEEKSHPDGEEERNGAAVDQDGENDPAAQTEQELEGLEKKKTANGGGVSIITTGKTTTEADQKKVDYCVDQIDPYDHIPVENFKPPKSAPYKSSLQYSNAVKQMKKAVGKTIIGGEALRQQLLEEVNKLKVLRFELFCMYPPL